VELQSGRRRGPRDDPFHGDTCDVRGPGQPKKISPLLARHPTFQRSRADHHAPGDPRRRASSRRRITGDAAIACPRDGSRTLRRSSRSGGSPRRGADVARDLRAHEGYLLSAAQALSSLSREGRRALGGRKNRRVVGKRDTDPFELRSTREGEVPSRGSNPLWSLRRREDKGMRTTRTGLASLALSTLAVLAAVPCLALMMR